VPRGLQKLKSLFCAASVVLTVILLILQFTPVTRWYATRLSENWMEADGDVLIVLGAEEENPSVIGLSSYWRSVYALRVWRAGHFRALVVSGGLQKGNDEPLAVVMGRFLASNGIPRDKIFLETRSTSTRENALFTAQTVAGWPGRKVLLTSDYHMFRARRAFESAGLEVIPWPFPDVLKQYNAFWNREYCVVMLAGETGKIAWYWWKGWL
jgi:uncharacterized SAM-binding protein YcdF (DUF218 family)